MDNFDLKKYLAEGRIHLTESVKFELNGREVVDLEADYSSGDPFIIKAYYLDTDKELTDDELDTLIAKYPAELELGGMWWDQQR